MQLHLSKANITEAIKWGDIRIISYAIIKADSWMISDIKKKTSIYLLVLYTLKNNCLDFFHEQELKNLKNKYRKTISLKTISKEIEELILVRL